MMVAYPNIQQCLDIVNILSINSIYVISEDAEVLGEGGDRVEIKAGS